MLHHVAVHVEEATSRYFAFPLIWIYHLLKFPYPWQ